MDFNRITLMGNISNEPEHKETANHAKVTKFHLATSHRWKDISKGDVKEKVDFHSIIAWGKLAETMHKFLHKGDRIFLEGRVSNRVVEDKSGVNHYYTDVIANNLIMISGKKKTAVATQEAVVEEINDGQPF